MEQNEEAGEDKTHKEKVEERNRRKRKYRDNHTRTETNRGEKMVSMERKEEKAGAELCQAQVKLEVMV